VNGGRLPEHVLPFCGAAALLAAALPLGAFVLEKYIRASCRAVPGSGDGTAGGTRRCCVAAAVESWLPSGIAVAVGMYISPRFTLPRVLGMVVEQCWLRWDPTTHRQLAVVVASGLVLGEGTASIFTAVMKAIFR
jgi:OPT oligopeptide transporter protein